MAHEFAAEWTESIWNPVTGCTKVSTGCKRCYAERMRSGCVRTEADAQLYGRLAGSIICANSSLYADPSILIKNGRGQSGLWGYAISGDLPIVLLRIGDPANVDLVRQIVQAHAYRRLKGLAVDLVIWGQ